MGFFIDNVYYQENKPTVGTIFQKCSNNGIDLPCFCYHESLSIAGNCRMCLVEASNSLKLVVSCAMPMAEEIKVYTNNIRVKKARESVLEFLLINHPLDCPICDQGGDVICKILH
jgi:NADH dehydrogenase/NADH:ubiquinone oxidoreductase subunit G